MAKQMTEEDRKKLDCFLGAGLTPAEAARRLGRPKSTVVREIIKRAVPCLRGYRSNNRICAKFDDCTRIKGYGGNPKRLFRCTKGCFEACPEFVERQCERLETPSRVCNGCPRFGTCPLKKRLYDASGAQANRESLLHESRRGVHPGKDELAAMDEVLASGLRKGQSIRHVMASNPEVFASVTELRTMWPSLLSTPLTVTSVPLRLVDTITMTARITATTRISPKIICHLVLLAARS